MPRRLHQTLADYVVIAISPALIMLLVGSLLFFLLRVFYQGDFQERLHWVMACFVFAAVLIARISIEQGFERAALFGAALAIVVGIAANRFVEYQGDWIESVSWLVNFTLIGVVWWCAHKLTWDCTVIDDAQDASGEGLMQIVGLERPAGDEPSAGPTHALEGTTARSVPAGYWQRYVEQQRRPHAPGVWVVYFSLAALPLFGIGQWFVPAADTAGRRYVFWLLCVYVASGLGLLLTTSFLGLRRYLRQRRIEMPTLMANLWLGTGAAIAIALLVAAALLPRPSAEYAISELPFTLGSPEQKASRVAPLKRDGTEDDEAERPDADTSGSEALSESGDGQDDGASADEGEPRQESNSEGSPAADGSESGEQDEPSADPSSGEDAQAPGADATEESSEAGQADRSPDESQSPPSESAEPSPSGATPPIVEPITSPLLLALRWAFYGVVALLVLLALWRYRLLSLRWALYGLVALPVLLALWRYRLLEFRWAFYGLVALLVLLALWRYRQEVLAAFHNFMRELQEWWASLWGRRRDYGLAEDQTLDIRVPPPAFATFVNPFTSGTAERYSPEELVRYSFEAFEAWSREHGCPREPEQTPHEWVRDVARLNAFIAVDARNLAELYARAAYARGTLPADGGEQLRQLWHTMATHAGTTPLSVV